MSAGTSCEGSASPRARTVSPTATPFALTGAYIVLQAGAGVPRVRDAFLFGVGASITFALAGAFVARGAHEVAGTENIDER